jgi:hypothetical protein
MNRRRDDEWQTLADRYSNSDWKHAVGVDWQMRSVLLGCAHGEDHGQLRFGCLSDLRPRHLGEEVSPGARSESLLILCLGVGASVHQRLDGPTWRDRRITRQALYKFSCHRRGLTHHLEVEHPQRIAGGVVLRMTGRKPPIPACRNARVEEGVVVRARKQRRFDFILGRPVKSFVAPSLRDPEQRADPGSVVTVAV